MVDRFAIERLGAGGDGIASGASGAVGPVYVPFALPGEEVTAERGEGRARLVSVERASPDRAQPFCPHFGRCGGCVAQHMSPDLYRAWKRDRLLAELDRAGLPTGPVEPVVDAAGEGRRRMTFHARSVDGRVAVGFMEARSHTLVPIDSCPITVPALHAAAPVAAALAAALASRGRPLDIAVTATLGGLDVDLRGSGPVGERLRQRLIGLAGEWDLARLSLHGDLLVERRPPGIAMGRAVSRPPPGGFLQATAAGEEALARAVVDGVGAARRVADLFAGTGPFTLRLAEGREVHAVDSGAAMLLALDRAVRGAPGLRQVTTETRDLFRRPLLPLELDRFGALVLDPPRSGAEAQVRQVIPSSLDAVVMVSCDPGTFARDAAALVAGGFAIERVRPVDQFAWSPHLEIVGVFRRARARARRR